MTFPGSNASLQLALVPVVPWIFLSALSENMTSHFQIHISWRSTKTDEAQSVETSKTPSRSTHFRANTKHYRCCKHWSLNTSRKLLAGEIQQKEQHFIDDFQEISTKTFCADWCSLSNKIYCVKCNVFWHPPLGITELDETHQKKAKVALSRCCMVEWM